MTIPTEQFLNGGDLISKQKITDEYILHSAVNNLEQPKLAVSLSTNEILHFDVTSQAKTMSFKNHTSSISGIKFSRDIPEVFYSSSFDGNIYAWDSRSGAKPVLSFYDDTGNSMKPLSCFDYNTSEMYLCAGTDLIGENSFLLFWDRRTAKKLGGYWDSHSRDITHVQFHLTCPSGMASSSVDGLINIFDLNESCEDDALVNTLNTERPVNKFFWSTDNCISCLTDMEDYQFWTTDNNAPSMSIQTKDLSSSEQTVDYLIDSFSDETSHYLVTGSNRGFIHLFRTHNNVSFPTGVLKGGHNGIVRTVNYCKGDRFISAGEDGILCLWRNPLGINT